MKEPEKDKLMTKGESERMCVCDQKQNAHCKNERLWQVCFRLSQLGKCKIAQRTNTGVTGWKPFTNSFLKE